MIERIISDKERERELIQASSTYSSRGTLLPPLRLHTLRDTINASAWKSVAARGVGTCVHLFVRPCSDLAVEWVKVKLANCVQLVVDRHGRSRGRHGEDSFPLRLRSSCASLGLFVYI